MIPAWSAAGKGAKGGAKGGKFGYMGNEAAAAAYSDEGGMDSFGGKGGFGGGGFGGKGKAQQAKVATSAWEDWSAIEGFDMALTEALTPFAGEDPVWGLEEMKKRVGTKFIKAAKNYSANETAKQRGTSTQAKVLVEEFVDACMGAASQGCWDKPWFAQANFAGPLLACALHTFSGPNGKIFTRTLAPMVEKYVEESLFVWKEDVRVQQAMWDAVETSGVKETHKKKLSQHLQKSYDAAHLKAPYGSSQAGTAELGLLQDFVRGWMLDFLQRAFDVLETGVGAGNSARDEQILFVTVLFQNLTASENACLPHELTTQIEEPPETPWPFVAESAESLFAELDADPEFQNAKRQRLSKGAGGKGKGSWWPQKGGGKWS